MRSQKKPPWGSGVSVERRGMFSWWGERAFQSEGAHVQFGGKGMVHSESLAFSPPRKQWERWQKLAEVPWRGLDFILRTMESFWRDLIRGTRCLNFYLEYPSGYCMGNGLELVWGAVKMAVRAKNRDLWLWWKWGGRQIREVFIGKIHKIWCSRRWGRGRLLPNFLAGPKPAESKWCGLQSCSLYYLHLGYFKDHFICLFLI